MTGDIFRHVRQGEPLNFSATFHNATADLLRRDSQNRHGLDDEAGIFELDPDLILVKNTGTNSIGRFGILSLGTPIISPTNNADTFKERVTFNGISPLATNAAGFCILLEPAGSNVVSLAMVGGCTPVLVNFSDSNSTSTTVGVQDGETRWLFDAGNTGSAHVLWRQGGTGTQYATIFFPVSPIPAYAKLSADWSSNTRNIVFGNPSDNAGGNTASTALRLNLVMPTNEFILSCKLKVGAVVMYIPYLPPIGTGTNKLDGLVVDWKQQENSIRVYCNQTGGSDSSGGTNPATYTYDLTETDTIAGATLFGVTPKMQRFHGPTFPAKIGIYNFGSGTNEGLWWCDETPRTGTCST